MLRETPQGKSKLVEALARILAETALKKQKTEVNLEPKIELKPEEIPDRIRRRRLLR